MRKKNLFLAIDGIDGTGKSTLINKLKKHLENEGHDVVIFGNPGGGTEAAMKVREVAFNYDLQKGTDLLAMGFCQMELWHKCKELLAEGKTVIVDRWTLSTIAYQGGVTGIPITTLNCYFTLLSNLRKTYELPNVDLHVWLHGDFELIKKRISGRTDKPSDKYEKVSEEWFSKIHGAYKYVYDSVKLEKNKRLTKVSYWGECYGINNLADIKITEETTPESNLQQVIQDLEMI